MSWNFALINNRLAELFFEKKKGKLEIFGHAYVKATEYKSKQEKKWIKEDTEKFRFVYSKGIYRLKRGHEISKVQLVTKDFDFAETQFDSLDINEKASKLVSVLS